MRTTTTTTTTTAQHGIMHTPLIVFFTFQNVITGRDVVGGCGIQHIAGLNIQPAARGCANGKRMLLNSEGVLTIAREC